MPICPALPRMACATLLAAASVSAHAAPTGYTDPASFQAATSGLPAELTNFDAQAAGTPVAGGAGFSLSVSASGDLPVVATGFWTTSGANYLGLNNADGQFFNGDLLSFTFTHPVAAFGLYVIGGADLASGFADVGVQLVAGAFSVSTGKTPTLSDGNGSNAFFIGVVGNGSPLSSVTLSGFSPGLLEYAVDDVSVIGAVPESTSAQLLFLGLLGLAAWHRSRLPKDSAPTSKHTTGGEST